MLDTPLVRGKRGALAEGGGLRVDMVRDKDSALLGWTLPYLYLCLVRRLPITLHTLTVAQQKRATIYA